MIAVEFICHYVSIEEKLGVLKNDMAFYVN